MHHLSIDVETYSSAPLGEVGAQKYVESNDFEILLFAYSLDGAPVQVVDMACGEIPPVWLIAALRDPDYIKHAYNANFEWLCLSKWYGLLPPEQWRCTLFHGLYAGFPGSLQAAGAAMGLAEDKQKLTVGKSLITYFCKPCAPTKKNGGRTRNLPRHDPEKWALFKTYNAQDVVTEMEIERLLSKIPVPPWLQQQWVTNVKVNYLGVALDCDLVAGALNIMAEEQAALMDEAQKLTGLENPNSIAQVTAWINRIQPSNDQIPGLTKEIVADWLQREGLHPAVRRLLEIRQELGKTSTKKYDKMAATVCKDGRVHGMMQFYKANRSGRWAGELVQLQNLPRTYLEFESIEDVRQLVKRDQREALSMLYGSVSDTLSQLIRTALVAAPGHVLIDADFSAIEARVISWLAQEEWRLEVFRTHGKIYEASASQMFGVPIDRIKKGNPEYALRQRGKVAELALGYGGGVQAMRRMDSGHKLDGVSDEEMQEIVNRWRKTNPRIQQLWYDLEGAAIDVVENGGGRATHGLTLAREFNPDLQMTFLTILLPSGRKSYYVEPRITQNRWGSKALCYYGLNQETKKWMEIETYGGKLTENCLAEGTPVLTDRGWAPIETVTRSDKIWDGVEWCSHDSLINQGIQEVIDVDGVLMTPNHKILTDEGWVECAKSGGLNWKEVQLPDSYWPSGQQHQPEQTTMALPMRMRAGDRIGTALHNAGEEAAEILRVQEERANRYSQYHTRDDVSSGVGCVALDETALHRTEPSSLPQLRRARNYRVRQVDGELRKLLGGHGPNMAEGLRSGPDRQQQGVLPGELPMDYTKEKRPQQENERVCGDGERAHDDKRAIGEDGGKAQHDMLSHEAWMARGIVIRETGSQKPVYDIRNCGPRHRFTIKTNTGPHIVSNCIQSIARDCLGYVIDKLVSRGLQVVFHIHDEVVIDAQPWASPEEMLKAVTDIMSEPIPWAPGLPLNADGWVGEFFRKD